jgi:hypothetical protein
MRQMKHYKRAQCVLQYVITVSYRDILFHSYPITIHLRFEKKARPNISESVQENHNLLNTLYNLDLRTGRLYLEKNFGSRAQNLTTKWPNVKKV